MLMCLCVGIINVQNAVCLLVWHKILLNNKYLIADMTKYEHV
jgi:hypothetical protein